MLRKIWIATRNNETGGGFTTNPLVFMVNIEGEDKLHHDLQPFKSGQLLPDRHAIYELDVEAAQIQPWAINYSSVRMGVRGTDAWSPEHLFVWGENIEDRAIVPLAALIGNEKTVSVDSREGVLSLPLRRVWEGGNFTKIQRLLIVAATADIRFAGTSDIVAVEMTTNYGKKIVDQPLTQDAVPLEQGKVSMAVQELPNGFNLKEIRNIRLRILGDNAWLPESLFLFGLGDDNRQYSRYMLPLAHLPQWEATGQKWLSADRTEGAEMVDLYVSYL